MLEILKAEAWPFYTNKGDSEFPSHTWFKMFNSMFIFILEVKLLNLFELFVFYSTLMTLVVIQVQRNYILFRFVLHSLLQR